MSERLTIILTHQPELIVESMVTWWEEQQPGVEILIAYGGPPERYDRLAVRNKVYIDDARLRTRDHQRERQSFAGVFKVVAKWLDTEPGVRLIHFTEFDCVPLCVGLFDRLAECLEAEEADVLGCQLERVDGTNHPHYLYHSSVAGFIPFLQAITKRRDPSVVLTMLGCLSLWKREAFISVAAVEESCPLYLEIALPTIAHHLGFRVRNLAAQSQFVQPVGDFGMELNDLRERGAWVAHPVKNFWENLMADTSA